MTQQIWKGDEIFTLYNQDKNNVDQHNSQHILWLMKITKVFILNDQDVEKVLKKKG